MKPNGDEGTLDGGVVGFYSLEMSAEQLAARILSEAAEIPSEQIRKGDMTEGEFRQFVDAAKSLESCPLYIDDTPALPISQLAARARRLKRTHGLDVLIIDYLQLVRPATAKDSRVNEVSEITQGMKAIAKELDIPVIALSQLSRQVENRDDKRPQLSDLRESGSIEQDADVVMFVFREEYYKEREKPGDHDLEKMAHWQEEMERLRRAVHEIRQPCQTLATGQRILNLALFTWKKFVAMLKLHALGVRYFHVKISFSDCGCTGHRYRVYQD